MLSTDMCLDPISKLVERVDGEKEAACYRALEDFLGGKFHMQTLEEQNLKRRQKEKEDAEKKKPARRTTAKTMSRSQEETVSQLMQLLQQRQDRSL